MHLLTKLIRLRSVKTICEVRSAIFFSIMAIAFIHASYALPSTYTWVGSNGGGDNSTYHDPLNWADGIVPRGIEIIEFNGPPASIDLNHHRLSEMQIQHGGPYTFTGDDNAILRFLYIDHPDVTFSNFSLSTSTAYISTFEETNLTLTQGSNWTVKQDFYVGRNRRSNIHVLDGSHLSAWDVARFWRRSLLEVTGSARFQDRVEIRGGAQFKIHDGGNMTATKAVVVGYDGGSSGYMDISGEQTKVSIGWELKVWDGTVRISDGADVQVARSLRFNRDRSRGLSAYLEVSGEGTQVRTTDSDYGLHLRTTGRIGSLPGPGKGAYFHSGATAHFPHASFISDGNVFNGYLVHIEDEGTSVTIDNEIIMLPGAELLVDQAATLNAGSIRIIGEPDSVEAYSRSYLTVQGAGSTLNVTQSLAVGDYGATEMHVLSGSEVRAESISVSSIRGYSSLLVDGANVLAEETITLGSNGGGGRGELIIQGAGRVTANNVEAMSEGVTRLAESGRFHANTFQTNGLVDFSIQMRNPVEDPMIDVAGSATIAGNLNIDISTGLTLAAGDAITLIAIGGIRSGTFNDIPEAGLLGAFNDVHLLLTYAGGDGNDVVAYAVTPADFDGDGDVDGVDLGVMFANFNGPSGGVPADTRTDLDGDGDVDGVDVGTFFGQFTGPLAPANVPEPASLALLSFGGLLMTRRRA